MLGSKSDNNNSDNSQASKVENQENVPEENDNLPF